MKDSIAFYLSDSSRLLRKRFDIASRAIGATDAQWRVLLTLSRHPGASQATLADLLDVEPITTCRMVDRLEQAGLVERRRDPGDRRAWQVYITDKAIPLIGELRLLADTLVEEATAGLSDEEKDQLRSLLVRVRSNLTSPPVDDRPGESRPGGTRDIAQSGVSGHR